MSLTGAVSPAAICEIVRKGRVDLVVIGTQAQDVRKSDLDSAAEEVLHTVPCPMLIIGRKVTEMGLAKGALERIVYVTNYTTSSLDGLPYTLALAQDHDAQLKFVHVSEEATMGRFYFGSSRTGAFRKRLESLVGSQDGLLRESEFVIAEGDRSGGLVRVAANLHASLIAMSAQQIPDKTPPHLLWPMAGQVVHGANCPVLIVRGRPLEEYRRMCHEEGCPPGRVHDRASLGIEPVARNGSLAKTVMV
jgi:nucleotide-binding universal stress UspA family protein